MTERKGRRPKTAIKSNPPPASGKNRHAVGSMDWVRDQVLRRLIEDGVYGTWVQTVYPDRVVVENSDMGELAEIPYTISDGAVTLGEPTAVSVEYVAKGLPAVELTGPIVCKADDKQLVYAPVLVPDEPDSDGDIVDAAQIERVAHLWLEKYQNIDLQHTLNNVGRPVESYIAPVDLEFPGGVVPKGSWMLAARVPDALWPDVRKGALTGFSLMAVESDEAAAAVKNEASIEAAWKRTTLADLADGWVVPFVSIVDTPAVPKAKWVALKAATDAALQPSSESLVSRLRGLLTGEDAESRTDKAGRRFSQSTYNQLKSAAEALTALIEEADKERGDRKKSDKESEMNEAEIRELVKSEVGEQIAPVSTAISEIGEAIKALGEPATATLDADADTAAEPVEGITEDADEDGDSDGPMDAINKELAELREFKAQVEKRLAPKSKSLKAADTVEDAAPDDDTYTDAFGTRYRRDASGRARQVV